MKAISLLRDGGKYILACCALATVILTGCSDTITEPNSSNILSLGNTATIYVSDPVPASEAEEVRANIRQNANDTVAVQVDELETIILNIYADAEILGIHLDYDRDDLNYECVVRSGGKIYVIVISPETGEVKEKKEIKEYFYSGTVKVKNKVKIRQACDRAEEIADGDVVEANIEEIEGEPTYIIIIITNTNRYVTIYIDANTGKEKKLKDEEKCGKHDDDEDDIDSDDDDGDDDGDDKADKDCDRHKDKKGKGRGHYRHGKGKGYGHHFHCHCRCHCDDDDDDDGGNSDSLQVITKDSVRIIVEGMFGVDSTAVGEITLNVADDSTATYATVVENGEDRYEVTLDAETGALISVKQTAGDFENGEFTPPTTADGKTLVPLSTARTAALLQLTGTMKSWTLERNETEARWVYLFEIEDTSTSTVKTVRVDAETGLFIDITG